METSHTDTLWVMSLRRWKAIVATGRFWLVVAMFWIVGVAVGPWGTYETLSVVERAQFSAVVSVVCWTLGVGLAVPLRIAVERMGIALPWSMVVATSMANLAIIPVLIIVIERQTGAEMTQGRVLEQFLLISALVSIIALALLNGVRRNRGTTVAAPEQARPEPVSCPLLERLEPERRGKVHALLAQDHYVEVVTSRGSSLVLMRLSDAMQMCTQQPAMQVHRSAWVALTGIASLAREGRRLVIRLHDGRQIPVARSLEADVRAFINEHAPALAVNAPARLAVPRA